MEHRVNWETKPEPGVTHLGKKTHIATSSPQPFEYHLDHVLRSYPESVGKVMLCKPIGWPNYYSGPLPYHA